MDSKRVSEISNPENTINAALRLTEHIAETQRFKTMETYRHPVQEAKCMTVDRIVSFGGFCGVVLSLPLAGSWCF